MSPAVTNLNSLADCRIQLGFAALVGLLDETVSNSVRRCETVRRRLKSGTDRSGIGRHRIFDSRI